ncbi:hypothetical protein HNP73_001652 [Amaricoccus macauensis]|uniref:Uncharacterized protein n=1 Tax=Amaricoccus macauensis TaxID=57001 RepID=A0A840SPE1_9RHOB|nr:hypothetical protein [Amaricoccus macauensis]MBB5221716.1 hypothetical protein [Amaricoccus macauensis]
MRIDGALTDLASGIRQSAEEQVIGALIMMPFTATLVLGWMMPLPNLVAILLFIVLTLPAGLWNAGMRARGQ